jgi:hypothetical protein
MMKILKVNKKVGQINLFIYIQILPLFGKNAIVLNIKHLFEYKK